MNLNFPTQDDPVIVSSTIPYDKCHGFVCECGIEDYYHNDYDREYSLSPNNQACMEFSRNIHNES